MSGRDKMIDLRSLYRKRPIVLIDGKWKRWYKKIAVSRIAPSSSGQVATTYHPSARKFVILQVDDGEFLVKLNYANSVRRSGRILIEFETIEPDITPILEAIILAATVRMLWPDVNDETEIWHIPEWGRPPTNPYSFRGDEIDLQPISNVAFGYSRTHNVLIVSEALPLS
jgi:hypothetical protein